MGDTGVDGIMIRRGIFKEWDVHAWTRLISFGMEPSGGGLWAR
jgi:hypothetical protein